MNSFFKYLVVWVLVTILVSGATFFAGTKYQTSLKIAAPARQGMAGR